MTPSIFYTLRFRDKAGDVWSCETPANMTREQVLPLVKDYEEGGHGFECVEIWKHSRLPCRQQSYGNNITVDIAYEWLKGLSLDHEGDLPRFVEHFVDDEDASAFYADRKRHLSEPPYERYYDTSITKRRVLA